MTGQYNARNYVKFGMLDRGQTTLLINSRQPVTQLRSQASGNWARKRTLLNTLVLRNLSLAAYPQRPFQRRRQDHRSPFRQPIARIQRKEKDYTGGEYGPQVCTDFICDFIDKNKKKPFLVYYPMILTHCPFDPTPDSTDWDSKRLGSTTYKGDRNDPQRHFRDMVAYAEQSRRADRGPVGKIRRATTPLSFHRRQRHRQADRYPLERHQGGGRQGST